jgi:hypothetical protein
MSASAVFSSLSVIGARCAFRSPRSVATAARELQPNTPAVKDEINGTAG